ncbi:DUF3592 domain-containing protein [Spirosoma sp. BT702]|uniref:DUF3592 domain-containing protein n=1 Tax=Spirosoma profusum TaxID=2771354 RepID=A0A927G9M5_9BACT|nr:DUF3592 domain-containing protein [Spirosoma profusum]MBD2704721.1 DUF3592 domain-containing protein [Spirosoma profusum]
MGYIVSLLIGITLFVISITMGYTSMKLIRNGTHTTATVIDLEKDKARAGYVYRPIFKFSTTTGDQIKQAYGAASNPSVWKVGDQVTVAYELYHPEKFVVLTFFGAYGSSIVCLLISLPFIVIGSSYFWVKLILRKAD